MRRPRLVPGLIVLALAVPAGLGASAGASTPPAQRCTTLTGSATISPGATNVAADQRIVAHGTLRGCTPATATGGRGTMRIVISVEQATCTTLAGALSLKGFGKATWANGETSSGTVRMTTSSSDPTLAQIGGRVKYGMFVGKVLVGKFRFTPVFTGTGPECRDANPLNGLTFTNKISDTQTVNFRLADPIVPG